MLKTLDFTIVLSVSGVKRGSRASTEISFHSTYRVEQLPKLVHRQLLPCPGISLTQLSMIVLIESLSGN